MAPGARGRIPNPQSSGAKMGVEATPPVCGGRHARRAVDVSTPQRYTGRLGDQTAIVCDPLDRELHKVLASGMTVTTR